MTLIKKIICMVMAVAWVLPAFAQFEYIETQVREEKKETQKKLLTCGKNNSLRISTFTTNPPFAWTEKQEEEGTVRYFAKGYNVDFLKQITDELGIQAKAIGYKTDQEVMKALAAGKVDVVVGVYYDPSLGKLGHILLPSYLQNLVSVIFMKGKEKEVHSFDDLTGLKGVVRKDEQFYDYVYKMMPPGAEMTQVSSSKEAFTKLLTGEVDYMLASPYSAEAEARRFKMNLDISMLTTPLLGQELFVIYSKQSVCPKYAGMIIQKIKEKRKDMHGLKRNLISYIDSWGQRFKNDPPLADKLGIVPSETEPITPEKSADIITAPEETPTETEDPTDTSAKNQAAELRTPEPTP